MEHIKGKWEFKREEYIVNDVFSSIETDGIKICYLKEPHYIPDCGDRTWYNAQVEVMKANAERIVKAVNCHDDLVEALKACRWLIANRNIYGGIDWEQAQADVGEALAKVEVK